MAAEQDPGLWKEILAGAVAALTAVFSWMFRDAHSKIDKAQRKADAALPKEDFEKHLERSLDDRRNLREDVKELFSRDDNLKDMMNHKFDELRRDMNGGFDRLAREIRGSKADG